MTPADPPPAAPRLGPDCGVLPPLGVIAACKGFDVDQSAGMRRIALGLTVEHELVLEELSTTATMHQEVFQLSETCEMDLQLRITPEGVLAHLTAAKAILRTADLLRRTVRFDHVHDEPRSRRVCGGSSSSVRPSTSWAS